MPSDTPPEVDDRRERTRILDVYGAYERDASRIRAWRQGEAVRFMRATKWNAVRRLLDVQQIRSGTGIALDLGAGDGADGQHLLELGWRPEQYLAVDLRPDGMRRIRSGSPGILCAAAQASRLPLPDASLGCVHQSTMVSSILSEPRREEVYGEIRRVLASGGIFISYDMRRRNPWNPNTRPVTERELRRAFAGWGMRSVHLTALPPLMRLLGRIGPGACRLAEAVPFLRTHLLFLARKP